MFGMPGMSDVINKTSECTVREGEGLSTYQVGRVRERKT